MFRAQDAFSEGGGVERDGREGSVADEEPSQTKLEVNGNM